MLAEFCSESKPQHVELQSVCAGLRSDGFRRVSNQNNFFPTGTSVLFELTPSVHPLFGSNSGQLFTFSVLPEIETSFLGEN